ncbi:MAG: hypothetical protein HY044_01260 [Candidatus Woesebacteria bacterium]|nr:MAG: hypothetical protein HY044_01260 [Candidatus Woesebacteria bacterium]
MKNLLIYINPKRDFDDEGKIAVKIQIDNSLDLGWKRQDLLLVTNFAYEYNGVKSFVIGDENFCPFCPAASKINVIINLLERKLIEKGTIYWFHDLDAYQLINFAESELEFDKVDILLPDFGRYPKWSTGSFFFKDSSEDIFNSIKNIMYKYQIDEEKAFCVLTRVSYCCHSPQKWFKSYPSPKIPLAKNIYERIKKANITYNFHSFNVGSNYVAALKPIRVAHFHFAPRPINPGNPRPDQLDFFLRGKNRVGVQILPERLVKIFNRYGVK